MFTPQLLVSVRNPLEARAAAAGGCDLLDVKEPARGPLGMADQEVMSAVATYAAGCHGADSPLPCSVALGELIEWQSRPAGFSLAPEIDYVKFGPAGIDSPARWSEAWQTATSRLDESTSQRVRWVAVAYADWQAARSLEPLQILEAAIKAECDVLLIDTYRKDSRSLLSFTTVLELQKYVQLAHSAGLKFGLAGSLRRSQLPELVSVEADIIGVRSAVCAGGRRTAPISATAVRNLKRDLVAGSSGQRELSSV